MVSSSSILQEGRGTSRAEPRAASTPLWSMKKRCARGCCPDFIAPLCNMPGTSRPTTLPPLQQPVVPLPSTKSAAGYKVFMYCQWKSRSRCLMPAARSFSLCAYLRKPPHEKGCFLHHLCEPLKQFWLRFTSGGFHGLPLCSILADTRCAPPATHPFLTPSEVLSKPCTYC